MVDTLTFVFDASNQYLRLAEQTSDQLTAIISQMNSVDPNSPNAQARVDELDAKYFQVQNNARNELLALSQEFDIAYNQLNPILKKNGVLISAVNDMRDFRVSLGTTRDAFDAAEARKEQQINAANAPKPPITSPKPVTTSAPTTTAPPPTSTPKPKTKPEPIAVTADVDPITGRTEPISVISGDPAINNIDDDAIITGIINEPPPTTDPNFPRPLGDDIDDIYDPNLTPEQIASLSPGDQQARAAYLAEEAAGTSTEADDDQEIIVNGAVQQADAFKARKDWRVRLALSDDPSVNYLYRAPNPGILNPLNATNGVIFPYTPTISVNYAANYNATELVHSNYKVYQYSSSSIDSVTIACDFTAQSTYEANYLLAVIHFFRAATKMFYGQDENPRRGTPPPLCYIYGMGSYQFAGQPLAISQFSYNLPNNVDYIKTSVGGDTASATTQPGRMAGTGVSKGGVLPPPDFTPIAEPDTISWVPSKIQLTVTCVPMMSRNAVSNEFSFEQYATGSLLNGVGKRFGGFW